MRAAVVLRAWLRLRIGPDQEGAELLGVSIDLLHFMTPPKPRRLIERVRALQAADLDGRGEARGQINFDAKGAKDAGQSRRLFQVLRRQPERVRVDIIEHR